MKRIVNFIVLFLILYLGNQIAPEAIVTNGWKTTLMATVICYIAQTIVALLMIAVTTGGYIIVAKIGWNWLFFLFTFGLILIAICLPAIALYISGQVLDGFAVHGTITYAVLIFMINILSYSDKKSRKDNSNQ